ncbi:MAG: PAS domain-containing protein [Ilumatobacteraceae bacterium]
MVEHSTDVVVLIDPAGSITYASPGLRAMLGYDPDHWAGRSFTDLVDVAEHDVLRRQVEHVVESGAVRRPRSRRRWSTSTANSDGRRSWSPIWSVGRRSTASC